MLDLTRCNVVTIDVEKSRFNTQFNNRVDFLFIDKIQLYPISNCYSNLKSNDLYLS
ncbi:MAG: hypothetical protein V5789_08600 [Colwellia sp.]